MSTGTNDVVALRAAVAQAEQAERDAHIAEERAEKAHGEALERLGLARHALAHALEAGAADPTLASLMPNAEDVWVDKDGYVWRKDGIGWRCRERAEGCLNLDFARLYRGPLRRATLTIHEEDRTT
jgi:hypothetical protein